MTKMSKRKILAEDSGFQLVYKTAGQEIAGAGMRETKKSFGVLHISTRTGQWFKTREEADKRFNHVTNI